LYAPYADLHFLNEAKIHLTERFWEMYLGCTLLQNGFDLHNPSAKGPEFYCIVDGVKCWFEAIAPGPGERPDSVPQMEDKGPTEDSDFSNIPEEKILLRLRSAIQTKHLKLKGYLCNKTVNEKDAYILAINSKRILPVILNPNPPIIVKAVFPLGNLTFSIDTQSRELVDVSYQHRGHILKQNSSAVSTDVFLDPEYANISAVIYSSVDVANYPSTLGADFCLVHNPFAKVPIRHSVLPYCSEYWKEGNHIKVRCPTEGLYG